MLPREYGYGLNNLSNAPVQRCAGSRKCLWAGRPPDGAVSLWVRRLFFYRVINGRKLVWLDMGVNDKTSAVLAAAL